ncbi:MAG: hypothetical protein NT150_11100 [Bacteroidetes bacterium]|nr:hypothetical protein [Bacteroidota bacterium]
MKNKKLTYVLIPVVLLVWVIVGYKIYVKYVGGDDATVVEQGTPQFTKSKKVIEEFSLQANYRDPFLGNSISEPQVKQVDQLNMQRPDRLIPQPIQIQKPIVRWPNISIGGKVNSTTLILIGNRRSLMKAGDEEMGVSLIKLYKDSVKLKFQGEVKTFLIGESR